MGGNPFVRQSKEAGKPTRSFIGDDTKRAFALQFAGSTMPHNWFIGRSVAGFFPTWNVHPSFAARPRNVAISLSPNWANDWAATTRIVRMDRSNLPVFMSTALHTSRAPRRWSERQRKGCYTYIISTFRADVESECLVTALESLGPARIFPCSANYRAFSDPKSLHRVRFRQVLTGRSQSSPSGRPVSILRGLRELPVRFPHAFGAIYHESTRCQHIHERNDCPLNLKILIIQPPINRHGVRIKRISGPANASWSRAAPGFSGRTSWTS